MLAQRLVHAAGPAKLLQVRSGKERDDLRAHLRREVGIENQRPPHAVTRGPLAGLPQLEQRLGADVGATSVAFAFSLPPDLLVMSNNYTVEGPSLGSPGPDGVAEWNVVSPAYFSTMGIRLRAGRVFGVDDGASSPPVAIVNEAFVRRHYPDGQAVGRRLKGGDFDPAAVTAQIEITITDPIPIAL